MIMHSWGGLELSKDIRYLIIDKKYDSSYGYLYWMFLLFSEQE